MLPGAVLHVVGLRQDVWTLPGPPGSSWVLRQATCTFFPHLFIPSSSQAPVWWLLVYYTAERSSSLLTCMSTVFIHVFNANDGLASS